MNASLAPSVPEMTRPVNGTHVRLSADVIARLREPFAAELIKWKVQTKPSGRGASLVVAYIDARDVAERLDQATGGDWWNEFSPPKVSLDKASLECALTVCGVTRRDVGSVELGGKPNGNETKALHSDAFKRAAALFGVAAHLYRFPTVWAQVQEAGNSWRPTDKAEPELYDLAKRLIAGQELRGYSSLSVRGSSFGADGNMRWFTDPEPEPALPREVSAAEADYFAQWGELLGGTTYADVVRWMGWTEGDGEKWKPCTVADWLHFDKITREAAEQTDV